MTVEMPPDDTNAYFYFLFFIFYFFSPFTRIFTFPFTFLFVSLGRQLEAGEKRKEGRGRNFRFFLLPTLPESASQNVVFFISYFFSLPFLKGVLFCRAWRNY